MAPQFSLVILLLDLYPYLNLNQGLPVVEYCMVYYIALLSCIFNNLNQILIHFSLTDTEATPFCEKSLSNKNKINLLFDAGGAAPTDLSTCTCTIVPSGASTVVSVRFVDVRLQNKDDRCTLASLSLGAIVYNCDHDYHIYTLGSSIDVSAPVNVTLKGLDGQTNYPSMVWITIEGITLNNNNICNSTESYVLKTSPHNMELTKLYMLCMSSKNDLMLYFLFFCLIFITYFH